MVGAEILNLEQFDSADLRDRLAMSAHIDHLSVPEVDPPSMKIKELKEYLRVCGVSIAGVTERSELVALAQKAKNENEDPHVGVPPIADERADPDDDSARTRGEEDAKPSPSSGERKPPVIFPEKKPPDAGPGWPLSQHQPRL